MKRKQIGLLTIFALLAGVFVWTAAKAQTAPVTVTAPTTGVQYSYTEGACYKDGERIDKLEPGEPCIILHQVKKDENLHILAAYYYGDARAWRRIYNLNRRVIRDPNVIYEGQIIKIEIDPGWVPRYDLEHFMAVERARQEAIGKKAVKVIKTEETITPTATIEIMFEEEEPAAGSTAQEKPPAAPAAPAAPTPPAPPAPGGPAPGGEGETP